MDKIEIIKQITSRHPFYGKEKGWSWYHGGMEDTGEWYFRKMFEVSDEELKQFLDEIIKEENIPIVPLTEDEIRRNKIIIPLPNGGFANQLFLDRMKSFSEEMERKFLFGTNE